MVASDPKTLSRPLGLVRSQVRAWLARAEQDGLIQQASKNPATFILTENQLTGVVRSRTGEATADRLNSTTPKGGAT